MLKTFILTIFTTSIFAATWSESSVSFLRGSNFELADNNRSEITFEQATGMKYGDSFLWLDVTDAQSSTNSGDTELYGEWSPRMSFGKILNKYDDTRFIKDVLLATTLEFGNSGRPSRSRLYGIGIDLKIPYFAFFQYNLYVRNNIDKTGSTLQSTFAYKLPINFSEKIIMNWSAYIDIVHGDEGTESDNTLTQSYWHTGQQLNLDVGNLWGQKNSIYAGIEYQYWNRKYGIKGGPVENNLKWMVKWIF